MCNYLMEKCEQQTFSSCISICVNENERKNFFYVRRRENNMDGDLRYSHRAAEDGLEAK